MPKETAKRKRKHKIKKEKQAEMDDLQKKV
jgi:hypothetical protein